MSKKSSSKSGGGSAGTPTPQPYTASEPELILVAQKEVGMRASREHITSEAGADMSGLESILTSAGVLCRPLFGESEQRVLEEMAAMPSAEGPETALPDLSLYYRVEAPTDLAVEDNRDRFRLLGRGLHQLKSSRSSRPVESPKFSERTPMRSIIDK